MWFPRYIRPYYCTLSRFHTVILYSIVQSSRRCLCHFYREKISCYASRANSLSSPCCCSDTTLNKMYQLLRIHHRVRTWNICPFWWSNLRSKDPEVGLNSLASYRKPHGYPSFKNQTFKILWSQIKVLKHHLPHFQEPDTDKSRVPRAKSNPGGANNTTLY